MYTLTHGVCSIYILFARPVSRVGAGSGRIVDFCVPQLIPTILAVIDPPIIIETHSAPYSLFLFARLDSSLNTRFRCFN